MSHETDLAIDQIAGLQESLRDISVRLLALELLAKAQCTEEEYERAGENARRSVPLVARRTVKQR